MPNQPDSPAIHARPVTAITATHFPPGFRLPGYEKATMSVVQESLQLLTHAHLPEPLQFSNHTESEPIGRQLAGSTPIESGVRVRHEATVEFESCMDGRYRVLIESMALHIEDAARQVENGLLDFLDNYLTVAGQTAVARVGASILDRFLDGLDITLVSFDDRGQPEVSSCYLVCRAPEGIRHAEYSELVAALASHGSPEQRGRFREIMERKLREWNSRERNF